MDGRKDDDTHKRAGDDAEASSLRHEADPQAALETMDEDHTPTYDLRPVDTPQADPEEAFGMEDEAGSSGSSFPETTSLHGKRDGRRSADSSRFDAAGERLVTTTHRAFSIEAGYANLGEIARGNMGSILRARDRDLERDVALKVMLDKNSKPEARMRFLREAQITGQLEHPNIVPIHCLGTDTHGNPVFSMKLVRGITVDQVIEETLRKHRKIMRDWPLERLAQTLVPVCHAIEFAHSKGVIHRDLKPSNIMLGDFGEVLVMDWGLAKPEVHELADTRRLQAPLHRMVAERRKRTKGLSARQHDATAHGAVIGTPKYMSPEQARGDIDCIDPRSDVYALGAILYDILTLSPPVNGESVDEILERVMAGDIAPPERANPRRDIPKDLAAVAMKAMSLHPRDRYQSVAAFRQDLQSWQQMRSVSAREDSGWEILSKLLRRNRSTAMVAAIAAMVLLAGFAFGSWSNSLERGRTQQLLDDLKTRTLQHDAQLRNLADTVYEAARGAIHEEKLATAIEHCRQAIAFDSAHLPSLRMLARLLIIDDAYLQAEQVLQQARALDQLDHTLDRMAALCRQAAEAVDDSYGMAFAALFAEQADELCRQRLLEHLERRFVSARRTLATRLPGSRLERDVEGRWRLRCRQLPDPLLIDNMPLSVFTCEDASDFTDCDILRGMPLRELRLGNAYELRNIDGLRGCPLEHLEIENAELLTDIDSLGGPSLRSLHLGNAASIASIAPLATTSLEELILDHCDAVSDFTPLVGLPLRRLGIHHNDHFTDLALIADLPVEDLTLTGCGGITDLGPLAGTGLQRLDLTWCTGVHDLRPLAALPLRELHLVECRRLDDLRPLRDLRLEVISFTPAHIGRGVETLRAMSSLRRIGTSKAALLDAEAFWKRFDRPHINAPEGIRR